MARNKHADLRKIKNSVRSNCYLEDISKGKIKKASFRKSCKNFKNVDGHLTYKWKMVIFDNGRKRIKIHDVH